MRFILDGGYWLLGFLCFFSLFVLWSLGTGGAKRASKFPIVPLFMMGSVGFCKAFCYVWKVFEMESGSRSFGRWSGSIKVQPEMDDIRADMS